MNHRSIGTAALAATATATLVAGLAGPAVAATTTVPVREGDLITQLSDTRATGSVDFLREGVRVKTGAPGTPAGSSTNKAAEYFALSGGIPTSGSYDWTGTSAQPGSQIVFDTDADRSNPNSFSVLVGEQVYSTNARGEDLTDWWLTRGSFPSASAKAEALGITCPSTQGGSGSDCHGSLEQWAAAAPDAEVYAGGFSLGSGVEGEGLLRSLTFGDTEYVFTSEDEVPEPVIDDVDPASGTVTVNNRKAVARMSSETQPAGTERGDKLTWTVKVDGEVEFTTVQDYDETDVYRTTFEKGSGRHRVVLLANGERVDSGVVVARR